MVAFNQMSENDINNMIHGYVHGHIHIHKDHTHIHGHIHSHAKNEKKDTESTDKIQELGKDVPQKDIVESNDDCPLEILPECDEVLCNELDDCFYLNCDDSNIESCCIDNYESICENENCSGPVNDPMVSGGIDSHMKGGSSSESKSEVGVHPNEIICNDPKCLELESTVCCYDTSHTKNHQNNLCTSQNNDKELFDKIFQELHQDFDLFTSNENNRDRKKFNGMDHNDYPATKKPKLSTEIHYPHEIHPVDNIHKAFFHTSISDTHKRHTEDKPMEDFDFHFNFSNKSDKGKDLVCEWDNCLKNVETDDLLDHLYNKHLKDEDLNNNEFPCEWNNCNFTDNNLYSLLDHLNSHKVKNENDIMTPLSNFSSESNFTVTPKPEIKDIKPELSEIRPKLESNSLNISNLSFKPKKKQIDPFFTCCWDIGVDSEGNPIKCNKNHQSAGDLQEHLIQEHIGSGKSSYECQWVGCDRHNGRKFTQRQKVLRHIHVHTNFKPCKCDICGSTFAVESMLVQHLRTHSGEKPFECSVCGKKFATSSSLSIHNRVHSGYKPLVCKYPGCGKRFSESSNLNKHMKTHMDKQKCNQCEEEFDSSVGLLSHEKSHESNIKLAL